MKTSVIFTRVNSLAPVAALMLSVGLLGAGTAGCGGDGAYGSSAAARSPASAGRSPSRALNAVLRDGDGDNDGYRDDRDVREYGKAAVPADRRAVAGLVQRYYAAASAGDVATVCSLVNSALGDGLSAAADGNLPQSGRQREEACASRASKLLESPAGRASIKVGKVEVAVVRIDRDNGFAILRLHTGEEPYMPVVREVRGWRIAGLFATKTI